MNTLPDFLAQVSFSAEGSFFFFAQLLLFSIACALPCFLIGTIAGWFQWSFLSGRTIRELEQGNEDLRKKLASTSAEPETGLVN